MASTSETGHEKNVENFGELIAKAKSMGTKYKPTSTRLQLPAMEAMLAEGRKTMKDCKVGLEQYGTAVNNREDAYDGIKKLSTRVMGALRGSDAKKAKVEDAKTWHDKIQNNQKGKNEKAEGEEKEGKGKSTSQQSYDKLKGNFEQLVLVLKGEAEYKPEEDDLKVATLEAYIGSLEPLNTEVDMKETALNRLREDRNKFLYTAETGLVDVAMKFKEYVKGADGADGPIYKKVAKIKFTRPKK
jgi:hypothetical protein